MASWDEYLEEARQETGYTGPSVPRHLGGIRAVLKPERLVDLEGELATLEEGDAFEAFLDHWWTQALADSNADAEEKERAIEFADLAISLRARAVSSAGYTQQEVEAMLRDPAS